MSRSWKTRRQENRFFVASVTIAVFFMGVASLSALERPSKDQISRYSQDGSLAIRIQNSLALGNHLVSSRLVRDYANRMSGLGLNPPVPADGRTILQNDAPRNEAKLLKSIGSVKALALLISFPDYPAAENPESIASKLFGEGDGNWPYESLRNYYRRSSYNAFNIEGNALGWFTPPYTRSGMPQTPEARENLIKDALLFYQSQGHDFSQYDADGDGAIDYLLVIWTGPDDGWGGFWWQSQTGFSDAPFSLNGTTLNHTPYAWLQAAPSGAPAFDPLAAIHETGHALGLPDYYDYVDTVGPRGGLGGLDMMDGERGDHNPFSKLLLGWVTPRIYDPGHGEISLGASGSAPDVMLVRPNSSPSAALNEFYLVQNRFRAENDFYLPGDGLLIWHVDSRIAADGRFLNNNSLTKKNLLSLVEADGDGRIRKGLAAEASDYLAAGTPVTLAFDSSISMVDSSITLRGIGRPGPEQSFSIDLEYVFTTPSYSSMKAATAGSPNSNPPVRPQAASAGSTYYVDATLGNDANSGLSSSAPWKTIAKVNASYFAAGDSILFKRGETWRDQLIVSSAGSPVAVITYGAYGTGALPTINGSTIVTGWTQSVPSYVWKKSFTYTPTVVAVDGIHPTHLRWNSDAATTFSGAGAGSYSIDKASNTAYVWCSDSGSPSNHTMEVAASEQAREVGILVRKPYITIEYLNIRLTTRDGVKIQPNAGEDVARITVRYCTLSLTGASAIRVYNDNNPGGTHPLSYVYISGNTISYARRYGIEIFDDVHDTTANYNNVSYCGWTKDADSYGTIGLYCGGSASTDYPNGTIFEYNTVHHQYRNPYVSGNSEGHGIQFDDRTANSICRYNLVYSCDSYGLAGSMGTNNQFYYNIVYGNGALDGGGMGVWGSTGTKIYNNVFYKNGLGNSSPQGIQIASASTNTILKNNIFAENMANEVQVTSSAMSGFVSDNNCVFHPAGGIYMLWGLMTYTLSEWKTVTSLDAHSIDANPLFVSTAASDFHLQAASPCLRAGADVGLTQDYAGNPVPAWAGKNPDIGAFESSNSSVPVINSITPSPALPQSTGTPITWTAAVTGGTAPLQYRYYLYTASTNSWAVVRDYSTASSWIWTPGQAGQYALQVWVRNAGSTADYDAWKGFGSIEITAGSSVTVTSLTASTSFPSAVGIPITWTAVAAGGVAPLQYQYWLYNVTTGTWSMGRDFSTSNTWMWTPAQGGQYSVQVWVRNAGSTATYDAWKGSNYFDITGSALAVTALTSSPAMPQPAGTTIIWTATASGGTAPLQYKFYLYNVAAGTWTIARDFSASNTWTWVPSQGGQYAVQVWVRNAGSTADYDAWKGTGYFDVTGSALAITSLTSSPAVPKPAGTTIIWTATASGGTAPLQYKFYLYSAAAGTWTIVRDFSTSNTWTWTPTQAGQYAVQVWVRNAGSTATYDAWIGSGYFDITGPPDPLAPLIH